MLLTAMLQEAFLKHLDADIVCMQVSVGSSSSAKSLAPLCCYEVVTVLRPNHRTRHVSAPTCICGQQHLSAHELRILFMYHLLRSITGERCY
jgi:hypothetical protein